MQAKQSPSFLEPELRSEKQDREIGRRFFFIQSCCYEVTSALELLIIVLIRSHILYHIVAETAVPRVDSLFDEPIDCFSLVIDFLTPLA